MSLTEPHPFVTIVMPIRQEAAFIRESLSAVLAQDYPAEFTEVIVADGQSTDGTVAIVESFRAAHPNLRLTPNPERFSPHGLNSAIIQARGDIIVRVDGHCEIAPDYVRRCVAHILTDGVDVVGGSIVTVGDTPRAQTIAVAMSTPFGVGDALFRTLHNTTRRVNTVPFPAYTRRILQQVGLFDEELVRDQDAEHFFRLNKAGAKILLAADVRSRYYPRSTLRSLWSQYFQYGFWKIRLMQKHPRQMLPRHFVPPLFVAALLGLVLLAIFTDVGRLALASAVAAYGTANLAAALWTARREGLRHLPLLPIVFATLHVSYGVGFWVGLVRFWNRWGDKVGKIPAWPATKTTSG